MNKKGFTLIEVVAVILLIGIISTIITVNYKKYLEVSKLSAYRDSMYSLIEQLEEYTMNNKGTDFSTNQQLPKDDLEIENKASLRGQFKVVDNYIVLVNVTNGQYCANGNKNQLTDPNRIQTGNCN